MEQTMTQRTGSDRTLRRFSGIWPGVLIGTLVAAGPDAEAQSDPLAVQVAAAGPTLYRVTNLGPGELGISINAKGQVAFAHDDPFDPEPPRTSFYDGIRLHVIRAPGVDIVRPTGLNDAGQVAGVMTAASGRVHSFVWSMTRGLTDIGTLPGRDTTWEPAINNRSEVTGYATAYESPPYPRAFRWSPRSGIEDLGVLLAGDDASSYGRAINDAGMIAGDSWVGGNTYHAFAWTRTGGMIDIDTLGNHYSTPVAAGARGEVGGNTLNPPDNYGSIFAWTRAAGMRNLGPADGVGTWMTAMSSGGRIVGVVTYADFSQHALTWTADRGLRVLGTLGGHSSMASGANNRGQVVGGAATPDEREHAFVWTEKNGLVDLNRRLVRAPAGLELFSALAVSDNGSIVAGSNAGLLLLRPVSTCTCTHAAGPVAAPDIVQPGAPVDASIGFATGDLATRYAVAWSWGDGTADPARSATASGERGSASARHTYATPGLYTITADVTDGAGNSARVARRIVVAPTSGGAIAGTGTVVLPVTTGRRSPVAGGPAHFAFLAPAAASSASSASSATPATSATADAAGARGRFLFSLPGFAFASDDVQATTAHGGSARLTGTGRVNGTGGYRFAAIAAAASASGTGTAAGKAGQFSVKIWHTDPKTSAEVIDYDSQTATRGSAGRPVMDAKIVVQ
jgi:probable HAF family extracellular repeat protein